MEDELNTHFPSKSQEKMGTTMWVSSVVSLDNPKKAIEPQTKKANPEGSKADVGLGWAIEAHGCGFLIFSRGWGGLPKAPTLPAP